MTEYRLVPDRERALAVGKAILEAHSQWEVENNRRGGQVAWDEPHATLLGQAAILAAAPPAPTREEVRAQIIEMIKRIVDSDYDGNLYYVEECADAILSLLGRQS